MQTPPSILKQLPEHAQGTLSSYIIGFALSIILTLAAYFLIVHHVLSNETAIATILSLGALQVWVQLFYFLHVGKEQKPRWNRLVLLLMTLLLAILVLGSLWIMYTVNERTMPSMDMEAIMQNP